MNNKNSRKKLSVAVVAAIAVGSASVALVACGKNVENGNTVVGHINVPSATIQAELGTYVSPKYDVVNDYGLILAGYTVSLKSVTDESGDALQVTNDSVLVETAGLYNFTYTAKSDRVKDATITIDFADRTAPTINFDAGSLPSFFIKGNTYRIPSYTLSGDYLTSKCWTKVFHIADDDKKTETELELIDGDSFAATHTLGKYRILIHVEDASGNFNEYPYERDVDGPKNFVEHKVAYFDEAFGARQASVYEPNLYKGEFVAKDAAGAQVYGQENGAYKVSFDGKTQTQHNEGLVYIHTPAVIDLTEYEALEMYVYNETEQENIIIGSNWWNDTACKKGEWTKVTWSTRNWGGENGNKSADNRKFIGVTDISGQTIRILFDYGAKIIPNGNVYFSAMTAVPKVKANVTTVNDDVILGASKYFVGDTVNLSAVEKSGKSVDCFTLNGKPIIGDSYVIHTTGNYEFGVTYKDGELTAQNMTWGVVENPTLEYVGTDEVWKYKIGESDKWVISYDIYDVKDFSYIGLYVGGQMKLIGFEFNTGYTNGVKFASYGYPWDKSIPEFYPGGIKDMFKGATAQSPVTVTYARDGSKIKIFLTKDGVTTYFTTVNHESLGVDNSFGLGERRPDWMAGQHHTYTNIRGIAGDEKVALYLAQFDSTLTLTDCTSSVGTKAVIGDWVTLTANPAPTGKIFRHFTVDGVPIDGNVMTVTKNTHAIAVVYADKSTLTLAEGIIIADGGKGTAEVVKGSSVTLVWRGKAPAGQYCSGFKVDGQPIDGATFTANGTAHSIQAVFSARTDNDNERLNAVNALTGNGGLVFRPNNRYKPTAVEYDTEVAYNGEDGAVDTDGSLKITMCNDENAFAFDNAVTENLDKYKEIYFYAYVEEEVETMAGSWWCNDTALVPYKWTKVSFDRSVAPQNMDEKSVWEYGVKQFIYRLKNGKAGKNVWVTPVYGVPYETSTVKFEGTGITTEDGKTVYNREDEIKLVFNGTVPNGKIFDCFIVNGTALGGDMFIATEKQYTVSVKFATSVSDMTWGEVKDYQTVGTDAKVFKVGESDQWVLRYDMTLPATGWNYFGAYVGGTDQLVGVEMHSDVARRIFGGYGGKYKQMNIVSALPEALRQVLRNSLNSPVRVVYVRQGDAIDMYIRHNATNQGWHVGTVSFAGFEVTGNSFGIGERTGDGMVNGTLSDIQFVTGKTKVDFYRNEVFKDYGEIVVDRPQTTTFYDVAEFTIPTAKHVANWLGEIDGSKQITIDRVEDQAGNRLTVTGNKVTLKYKGAQIINVVYKADGCSNKIVSYRLQPSDGTAFTPSSELGGKVFDSHSSTVSYTTAQKHGSDSGSIEINVDEVDGNGDYAYVWFDRKDYDYIEFYVYTASSGKQIGCHWYGDLNLQANAWTKVQFGLRDDNFPDANGNKYIFRFMNTAVGDKFYVSSAKLGKYTDTKILDFSKGAALGTWSTEKVYNGADSTVTDTGSLKITPNSGDYYNIRINADGVNVRDVITYSEIYFYVYTDATGAKAGIEWAGDTDLVAGQWTKVTVSTTAPNVPNARMDDFKYRVMNGNGGTFYFTSLYGVKKA